jgi:hypothetical protein
MAATAIYQASVNTPSANRRIVELQAKLGFKTDTATSLLHLTLNPNRKEPIPFLKKTPQLFETSRPLVDFLRSNDCGTSQRQTRRREEIEENTSIHDSSADVIRLSKIKSEPHACPATLRVRERDNFV